MGRASAGKVAAEVARRLPVTVLYDCNEAGHGTNYTFVGMKNDAEHGGGPLLVRARQANLTWGDYSVEGFEGLVTVERKTLADLFGTLGGRRDAFEAQVAAMNELYEVADIAVEATWAEALVGPAHSAMSPKSVTRTVTSWSQRYRNVHWRFLGSRAICERTVLRTLERFWLERQPRRGRGLKYPSAEGEQL